MRIDLELDDELVERASAVAGIETQQELINFALKERRLKL